jgi:hypothetical protein
VIQTGTFAGTIATAFLFAANAAAQIAVCHADGTPAERVAAQIVAAANAGRPQAANVSSGWNQTATNGSGLVRGMPITLTWSVIPDGTPINATAEIAGESSDNSNLVTYLNTAAELGSQNVWQDTIQTSLNAWSNGPGIAFVHEPNDDGVRLGPNPGVLGVRGDIRIGGHDIDGDANVVAYSFFPNSGDIVIDTADFFSTSLLRFRNVIAHEAGHAIGMGHVCPINQTKIMEPTISTAFSGPQFDDLLGAHRNYGDLNEDNGLFSNASDEGFAVDTTVNVNDLALDGDGDDDWFLLPTGTLTELSVTLNPAGTPYTVGNPTAAGSCTGASIATFDPTLVQDLRIDVIDFDHQTTIATANATGLGGGESVTNIRMSKLGGFIRVAGAGDDDVQRYELEVTLVPEPSRTLLTAIAVIATATIHQRRRRQATYSSARGPV